MRCAAATIPGQRLGPRGGDRTGKACAILLSAILSSWAAASDAGPWAREAGDVFLSFTISGEEARAALLAGRVEAEPNLSAFAEIGLGHRLTGGAELSWGDTSQMAVLFLRRTLTPPDTVWQVALDAGLGMRTVDGPGFDALVRLGGSVGRGFGGWEGAIGALPFGHAGGWATIEGAAYFDTGGTLAIWQTEATLGLRLADRLRTILALKAEEWPGADPIVTVRPSVVLDLREGTSLQAGLHAGIEGSDTVGLSLSLWQEF
jgi:hypothetical protein